MRATCSLLLALLLGAVTTTRAFAQQGDRPRCSRLSTPKKLPPVSSVLDSAELARGILPYSGGELLASLVPDPGGRPRVEPIGSWADAPDSVRTLLDAAVHPTLELDAPSIRVDGRPVEVWLARGRAELVH